MTRAALFAVLLALPARAQSDPKAAALDAFLAAGGAPRLAALLDRTGGRAEFAAAAPDDRAEREADWKAAEAMLSARGDPALGDALARLPTRQLYFAARLSAAARGPRAADGGKAEDRACRDGRCFERARALAEELRPLTRHHAFRGWADALVDARPGGSAQRAAECYWFRAGPGDPAPVVELVADAEDGTLSTAEAWFAAHDPATRAALAAAGKDRCGPTLEAVRRSQRDQVLERERRDQERFRKLQQLQESFSRMKTPF